MTARGLGKKEKVASIEGGLSYTELVTDGHRRRLDMCRKSCDQAAFQSLSLHSFISCGEVGAG